MYNGQSFRLVPIKHVGQKLKAFATAYSCRKRGFYSTQSLISLLRCILFKNYTIHMKTIKKRRTPMCLWGYLALSLAVQLIPCALGYHQRSPASNQ